ncbi:YicC/YloC family endoribonuclease [Caloranaerobacter azorensis]|uniref:YicC family protein n=1 Tax=Caloranaerobacter azorensis TaxID=116090 RepID=A0A6P1YDR5_9FIRM|nr:YicC/YloC family endoribonuclease [Caloranaerobacter azorensis]QIB26265.1 YicC family protein [Caloranaerobacter azorensis]
MIKSMTGFGRGESRDSVRHFVVEIKSVNHRYNDIIIKMPKHLNYIEDRIRKHIKNKISRGRVEVYINLEYMDDSTAKVQVDLPLAKSYKEAIEMLNEKLDIRNKITIDLIAKFPDVIKIEKQEEDEDEVWNCLKNGLEEAINKLIEMRIREGQQLAKDIKMRAENIMDIVKAIEIRSPEVVLEYKNKLKNRIEELLGDNYELDESRLANEVAFFADKSNIDEEIVRLYSHINQLISALDSDVPVGRRLDFLIQEMNREANTIGSKASDIIITNKVVELKSEIEKIREQIQNIE